MMKIPGCNYDNPNAIKITECGCCGAMHRVNYFGDCRNDDERFADPEDFESRWYGGGHPSIEVYADADADAAEALDQLQLANEGESAS